MAELQTIPDDRGRTNTAPAIGVFARARRYRGLRRDLVSVAPMTNLDDEATLEVFLARAKAGDGAALGKLFERYRNYLGLLARLQIGRRLQGKLDADDLLQEVSLEAHKRIQRFCGNTEPEFLAWLRQILAAILSNQVRRYFGTRRRDLRRERRIAAELDESTRALERSLVAPQTSPSQQASLREQAVLLADALQALPETYREVVILRHLEGLTFPEVAERMMKTEHSVKNIWARALARLRSAMEEPC
jgi:RNA polymerase sigma-70 factor (ECF subfamily)